MCIYDINTERQLVLILIDCCYMLFKPVDRKKVILMFAGNPLIQYAGF